MTEARAASLAEPDVGSYFVANYPPFSVWTSEAVGARCPPGAGDAPGPPACRSGCTCTFPFAGSAATSATSACTPNKNAQQVERTWTRSSANGTLLRATPAIADRPIDFVYFGGGTPSFLSSKQLESLVSRLHGDRAVDVRRGGHVRVRARDAHRGQARRHPARRRHASQPRRRELRRWGAGAERTRAPIAGDRAGVRLRARHRLPADQHRPHRRHARRDRRELAGVHPSARSRSTPTA